MKNKKHHAPMPNLIDRGFKTIHGSRQIAVRFDEELWKAVDNYALVNRRSLSNAVTTLVCEALNAHDE